MLRFMNLFLICLLKVHFGATTEFGSILLRYGLQAKNAEAAGKVKFYNEMSEYYIPSRQFNVSLSDNCLKDIQKLDDAVSNMKSRWGLQMLDSWGTSTDGLMAGNRKSLGFFEQCLRTKVPSKENPQTSSRYCLVSLELQKNTSIATVEDENFPQEIAALVAYATCFPASCTEQEYRNSLTAILKRDHSNRTVRTQCQSFADKKPLDGVQIFGIIFFSFLLGLVFLASIIDFSFRFFNRNSSGDKLDFLFTFSVLQNLPKVFHLDVNPSKEVFTCLHAIRFLSIAWVVFGHHVIYSLETVSNLYEALHTAEDFSVQLISNGDKCVDTFFTIGGILVSFNIFKVMDTKGKFPFIVYYFHRVIRLIPPIIVFVIYLVSLSSFTVTGPFAVQYDSYVVAGCRKFWWLDWSFTSNFIFRNIFTLYPNIDVAIGCTPHLWYLAVDMQLYVIVPFVLLPIVYKKKIGLVWFSLLSIATFVIPSVIIGLSGTFPTSMVTTNMMQTMIYNFLVYLMPWCRASPYFVGLWAGYILWLTLHKNVTLSSRQVVFGWSLSFVFAFLVMFSIYPYNHLFGAKEMSDIFSVVYGGFHRGLWGLCIAWLILACHWGYGGYINSILSYPAFQPLGRLTYCIYIISLPIQYQIYYSTQRMVYFTLFSKLMETFGLLLIIGFGALLLSLVSEVPIIRLEKLLQKRRHTPIPGKVNPAFVPSN